MKLFVMRSVAVLLFGALASLNSGAAQAGWGSLGGSFGGSSGGGSLGGGSSGGSSGYTTSYGSFGSHGSTGRSFTPVRSLLRGIHDHFAEKRARHLTRRAAYASYGSSGFGSSGFGSSGFGSSGHGSSGYSTSYGSYGSTGGGAVSYGSVGSSVSYGSVGGVALSNGSFSSVSDTAGIGQSPVYYGADRDSATFSNLVLASSNSSDADTVYLTVSLPSDAKVFVNGKSTTSTGSVREFVSRGLIPGKTYKFELRAELAAADGQVITEEKSIFVKAGGQESLQFAFADSNSPVETSLTINVPDDAKVKLAGNSTRATGSQRVFHTHGLKVGEVWDEYAVEVEYNGLVKQQTVRLIGGDHLELSFQFDDQTVDQIAAKR
jgi:uncharacterized protein (TIGR03000 family)